MLVKYPVTATTEASRLSYLFKLNEELRLWHNSMCAGMSAAKAKAWRDAKFKPRIKFVFTEIEEIKVLAEKRDYWKLSVNTNYVDNKVVYPITLNENNEGSRLVFLYGLQTAFVKMEQSWSVTHTAEALADFKNELLKAKEAAKVATFWTPKIEDIV